MKKQTIEGADENFRNFKRKKKKTELENSDPKLHRLEFLLKSPFVARIDWIIGNIIELHLQHSLTSLKVKPKVPAL